MKFPEFGKLFKNPAAIAAGLVVALVILVLAARSKTSGGTSGGDFTLQSQQIAAGANTVLAGYTTDYNKAALAYQGTLAQTAASTHEADLAANTTLALQALSTLDNMAMAGEALAMQRDNSRSTLLVTEQNNAAMLSYSKLQADLTYNLGTSNADLVRYITQSNNEAATRQVEIQAQTQDTANALMQRTAQISSDNALKARKVQAISDIWKNTLSSGFSF